MEDLFGCIDRDTYCVGIDVCWKGMATEKTVPESNMFTLNLATVSYEGSVFTWTTNCDYSSSSQLTCPSNELTMTTGFHCCAGSLKAIAISKSGKYLACGGNDEKIRIFNVIENKTLGELSTHTGWVFYRTKKWQFFSSLGAITALEFFEDSYLISGSDVSLVISFYDLIHF